MAGADFRSRNKRNKKTTQHSKTTQRTVFNDKGSATVPGMGGFVQTTPVGYKGKGYNYRSRNDPNTYARVSGTTQMAGMSGGQMEYSTGYELDLVGKKTVQDTQNYTTTSYKPSDNRGEDESDADRSEKANRKKKGRSGLRIALKADKSDGRLKGQDARVKKKSGAQGGGPTGLNIPR